MTAKEVYKVWAPVGKKWVDWVRPVPFTEMGGCVKPYVLPDMMTLSPEIFAIEYPDAAIIVDLPGAESVWEGLSLAKAGYRPIPVFNGTIEQPGARATVDNQSVGSALGRGAAILQNIEIGDEALPAFLLDSNRMSRYKMENSLFDNSWDIYRQDLPSGEYLWSSGIRKVIIMGESISKDLKKILYDYQKKKLSIFFMKRYGVPEKVRIYKQFYKN